MCSSAISRAMKRRSSPAGSRSSRRARATPSIRKASAAICASSEPPRPTPTGAVTWRASPERSACVSPPSAAMTIRPSASGISTSRASRPLMRSGWFGTWTGGEEAALEMAMYGAYHRWMNDYCGAYPDRLGGIILVGTRDVQAGLKEIERWGKSRWAWAVMAYAPYGVPLDHPSLEPVWAAAQDHDLAVVLHTFTVMPPYAPGGLDTWENLWL